MSTFLVIVCVGAVNWTHPAGLVTEDTVYEVRMKRETCGWAARMIDARHQALAPWLQASREELRRVFPKTCGNVYHNFSCPDDRRRLTFDPFEPTTYACPLCGKTYPAETDPGVYEPGERYHGTMYDGWVCLFYQMAASVAGDMGLLALLDGEAPEAGTYVDRGVEILMLYADTIEGLETQVDQNRQLSKLLTYHREGDNKVLNDLACAYEVLRYRMTASQQTRFEEVVLRRMLNDVMLEPIYTYEHNNLYQWHRTIVQTALALEREDLIDWSMGYGPFAPDQQPEHRSIRRLLATHFKPDGAYWEMCSGYHLYPLHALCELAVVTRNVSRMDSQRFPATKYDLTDPGNDGGEVIHRALEWFVSMSMPDRTMPSIGDSPAPRAGMDAYFATAEVGYRFFDVRAVGDYARLREGNRSWAALLYGAPQIVSHPLPFTSSYMSSGWVSLRNEWRGNRVWVGLNALIPGGGHQHADRLTFLMYSHGKLLGVEKATPYNESVTRVLGTLSQSHNTVTVDKASMKQGEELRGAEVPEVAYFFAGPVAQFAELHADGLYPQAGVYRRSVALIEDVVVDVFRVEGGSVHDWIVHHAGSDPSLSVPTVKREFDPVDWLYNGTEQIRWACVDGAWTAQWGVDDVTSQLTMLGAEKTDVYALETYPVNNAVITPQHPPCQTLCVRREDDAPFVAVWHAWRDSTNSVEISCGSEPASLALDTAGHRYYILFGEGRAQFAGDISLRGDGAFTCVRLSEGVPDAILSVGGTEAAFFMEKEGLHLTSGEKSTVWAKRDDAGVVAGTAGDIQYETYAGRHHYGEKPDITPTVVGSLWATQGTSE